MMLFGLEKFADEEFFKGFYMKKIFSTKMIFFIFFSLILISGCSFSGEDNTSLKAAFLSSFSDSSTAGKVCVRITFETPRGGTIFSSQELTELYFTGTREGGGACNVAAATKDELCSQEIWLHTGTWTFHLEGKIDGVTFKDTETVAISKTNTSISFSLKPYNGENEIRKGAVSLVLNFTGNADRAVLNIINTATGAVSDTREYTGLDISNKIEYSKTFKEQESDGLDPGTYMIVVNFYRNEMKDGEPPLNIWKAYARVKAGLTARTEISDFNLTDSYTISYHNVENATIDSSGVIILCYSRKSGEITLPSYTNAAGYKVLFWYETESFDVFSPGIKKFNSMEKLKNLDFYPLWDTDTVYAAVGGSGNGLTAENPLPNTGAAFAAFKKLHEYGSIQKNLIVQVSGEVTETAGLGIGSDFDYAESILLKGKNSGGGDAIKGSGIEMTSELNAGFNVMLADISAESIKISGGTAFLKGGAKVQNAEVSTKIKLGGNALISGILTMNPSASIEIIEELTQNPVAIITPSTYVNGWQIIADNEFTESNSGRFGLTPNPATSSSYRWRITEKGVLAEEETGNIVIKVYDEESDIAVSRMPSGAVHKFIPEDGYASYEWKVDGTVISSGTSYTGVSVSGNTLSCDTSTWLKGVYDIFLSAQKDGLYYSYHAQISKS